MPPASFATKNVMVSLIAQYQRSGKVEMTKISARVAVGLAMTKISARVAVGSAMTPQPQLRPRPQPQPQPWTPGWILASLESIGAASPTSPPIEDG